MANQFVLDKKNLIMIVIQQKFILIEGTHVSNTRKLRTIINEEQVKDLLKKKNLKLYL